MKQVQDDEIDLFELFQMLWDGKWLISAFVVIAVLLGGSFLLVQNAVYESKLIYSVDTIPPFYDSMISKLIVVAQTREEAIKKMQRALDEYIIEGVKTTIPFHQKLMRHPRFQSGDFTTKFMEEETV